MSKAIGWVATGLLLGVLITFVIRPSSDIAENGEASSTATNVNGADTREMSLREFEELSNRVVQLESKIDELAGDLRENRGQRTTASRLGAAQDDTVAVQALTPGASPAERSQGIAERLLDGGFAPDRAQFVATRSEEFLMAQIEARYESERDGEPLSMEALERLGPQYMLREELGDWEYERYLEALGRPTLVGVVNVLDNSPAARAGLMSGDQIVSYGGRRVFNVFEVTQLTREGTVGESMLVDIVRDGQPMQIIVPRGPLGAALSGNGLPGAVILPSTQNQ